MSEDDTMRGGRGRVALPVSLALNLFLAAVIVGHIWHNHHNSRAFGPPLGRALAFAESRLPSDDAQAFRAVIDREAPRFAQDEQQLMDARRELGRQISADKFDADSVRQAFGAWRAAWNHFLDDFSGTLLNALAQVSPEGRRKLVEEHHHGF